MNIEKVKVKGILRGYRYISLALTSLFYSIGTSGHSLSQRMMILVGMLFTAIVMDYLYTKNRESSQKVFALVVIETLGNCLLILPSGGLESPYVWYMINTLFISGLELGYAYLWGGSIVYLCAMGFASWVMNPDEWLVLERLNIVAGFLLVGVAIQLLVGYARALEEKADKTEHYLNDAMSIYETVYVITSQANVANWAKVILDYMTEVLKTHKALILLADEREEQTYHRGMSETEVEILVQSISVAADHYKWRAGEVCYECGQLIGIPIQYASQTFGVLLIEGRQHQEALGFLAYISGILLKNIELEELNKTLLLNQEQNRIANEIHDGVLQKLFGISCSAFAVANKLDQMEPEAIKKALNEMRAHTTEAMTELRKTIYGMSWHKEGVSSFVEKIENDMETMERLHEVKISKVICGAIEHLDVAEQKALYRVCCEGVSNGIRHGKADEIEVILEIDSEQIILEVRDNGKGFDYEATRGSVDAGLGLRNMNQLAQSIGGQMSIQSQQGKGTVLKLVITKK